MITLENVTKEFTSKKKTMKGVDNVSLKIERGEIFGIVGYSGAGKSTLLRCINLLERPTSGRILFQEVDLLQLSKTNLRKVRRSIGMIFQGFHLISSKTVHENIAFALKVAGVAESEMEPKVIHLLQLVGLENYSLHYPAQLSGGQKQRVCIARALANNPEVLLCDEATSALDPNTTRSILTLLKKINRELGITIVIVTHEMEVVKAICDRCAVMQDGRVIEQGLTYDIFSNPTEQLTRKFIETVLDVHLPDRLLEHVHGKLVRLHFRGDLATEGIISEMLKNHHVKGNILHGKVDYIGDVPLGIFIMEINGDKKEMDLAIDYLKQSVSTVEVLSNG